MSKEDYQPSLPALIQSANVGCILCQTFAAHSDSDLLAKCNDENGHVILIGMVPVGSLALAYIRSETHSRRTISVVPFNGLPYQLKYGQRDISAMPRFHSEAGPGELKAISGQVVSAATFDLTEL
jgi:hypothetical protein